MSSSLSLDQQMLQDYKTQPNFIYFGRPLTGAVVGASETWAPWGGKRHTQDNQSHDVW